MAWWLALGALLAWLAGVGLFFGWTAPQTSASAHLSAEPAPAAIVVLGSGTPHCRPSPALQARLDVALTLAQRWPQARVLTSGGPDGDRHCTEGRVMADALLAAGLPAARLLTEERSTSTDENLRFSQAVLAAHGIGASAPVRIVTSDFHVPRSLAIARRAGFTQAHGVGAPTPLALRYNAWLRESFAFVSGWLLHEY